MRKNSISLLLSIVIFSTFFANTLQAKSYKFILETGLVYGGDTLVENTSNGNSLIRMGDGLLYGFGVEVKTIEKRDDLYTSLTAAWLAGGILSSNGLLSRFPLTLTQYYTIQKWQVGAGLTYHVGNKYYADEDKGLSDLKFDNALGTTLSLTYYSQYFSYIGARATFIKYQAQDSRFPHAISGNSVGLFMKSVF